MVDGLASRLTFEDFALDIAASELSRAGATVPIEPQVFDLLVLLAQNHDRVVTKDEIIETVWNGRIVSDGAISTRINALRRALGDDGTDQRLIKTIHGRGFRFGVSPDVAIREPNAPTPANAGTKPSIAILPFQPLSGDIELEYFADGIAEDIINALSRFHDLSVIARNSSFIFKGTSTPARDIAAQLGVKYVLDGSVRQLGQRIRVAVQLIDANADQTIWSDRYDGDLSDIFAVQDEIASKAVNAIAPQTQYAEMASAYRKDATSLSDWERVMRARWHMDKYSREDTDTALGILEEAVATSPDLSIAYSSIAYCHIHKMLNMWGSDAASEIVKAETAARRATSLDAYDASAWAAHGVSAGVQRNYDICFDHLQKALDINPNCVTAYGFQATMYGCLGELEQTLASFNTAMSLSPADPTRALWMSGKGIVLFLNGKYEDVLMNADLMLRIQPNYAPAMRQRAASLAKLGRTDEAKQALAEVLVHTPGLTATKLRGMVPVRSKEHQDFWLDTLRSIGLPD